MSENYDRNHIFLDCDISRRLLNRSHRTLVHDIKEHAMCIILREMERTELLFVADIKDIKSSHVF